MLTSVHCITVTLIWAITVIGTVVTTTSAGMAAVVTLGIIALELAGFVTTLLMTRRPRRRDNNLGGAKMMPAGGEPGSFPAPPLAGIFSCIRLRGTPVPRVT